MKSDMEKWVMDESIMVVAEHGDGRLSSSLAELVAAAERIRILSGNERAEIVVLVAGDDPVGLAEAAAVLFGCRTLAVRWHGQVTPESLKSGLPFVLEKVRPAFLLFSHTTLGREVAPGVGAKLGVCALSGVTDIRRDEAGLVFYRPVMDNTRVLSLRHFGKDLCIMTVAPGAFAGGDGNDKGKPLPVIETALPEDCPAPFIRQLSVARRSGGNHEMQGAKIVVSAGQGIGDRENLEKVEALAARLPGACVGASRPLVDKGWVPYSRQVGITGSTVAPDLYIACGISGSSQHLAGMAGSKWVVSINKNPDAPICRHSDLCINADVNEFIDNWLEVK